MEGEMLNRFSKNISYAVLKELSLARKARRNNDVLQEFSHLENAHVLGQNSTYWHTKVHCHMLYWARRNGDHQELRGQLLRVFGALTKTAVGLVPDGNTGGSNVSPFKPLPISALHQQKITRAKQI